MLYPKKLKCPDCKIARLVDYRIIWSIKKGRTTARCFKCSRFKKGQTNSGGFKKGIRQSPATEFKRGKNLAEKHPNWKGDGVKYISLHQWIATRLGEPKTCSNCRSRSCKKYEWANISKKYKRELTNWVRLCTKCHRAYDMGKIQLK